MLKKIKKYKITVRPFFALRNLKRKVKLETDEAEVEAVIQKEIVRLQPSFSPSSIYETYSKMNTPEVLKPLWEQAAQRTLSLSLVISTIGSPIEAELEKARQDPDPMNLQIADSIAREALEQSLGLVTKLLTEEAKLEGCDLTPLTPMPSGFFAEILPLMESHKADIALGPDGRMTPFFSSVSYCFWNPVSKNKNAKNR